MTLLETVRSQLMAAASVEFADGMRQFFREEISAYGVRAPQIQQVARAAYSEVKKWPVTDRDFFMDQLWKSGNMEQGALAIYVYRRFAKSCGAREFAMFEKWIDRYVRNWGHCDGVSAWLLGACIANEPELVTKLDQWTKSKNRWKRRAAAVSLVKEAGFGRNTETIFRVCELLRTDEDDMVQKGVGWLLKETYPKRPRELVRFLSTWRGAAPRLVLRIAAEKMTVKDRRTVLEYKS